MISLLLFLTLSLGQAKFDDGQDVGSGGDVVECAPSAENSFRGNYSLDYLLTYRESNKNSDIVTVRSLDESLKRIRRNIDEKLPELSESFREFTSLVRNTDVALPRFWEEAPFGLVDIKDQKIINLVPMNCRVNGQVKIIQAVIRLNPATTGTQKYKLIYKFVPGLFQRLEASDPLQLSFLLVHEWLWDLSHNVEKNRRLNRVIHSDELESLPREKLRSKLTTLGLEIPTAVAPPEFYYGWCPADPAGARALVSKISLPTPRPIEQKVFFMRRIQPCPADGVGGCLQSTAKYLEIQSQLAISGGNERGEKFLYFRSEVTGGQFCRIDENSATIECARRPGAPGAVFDWYAPKGTVGKGCVRLFDSKFSFYGKNSPNDSLDEVVLEFKF